MSQDLFSDSQLFASQESQLHGLNNERKDNEYTDEESEPPLSQLSAPNLDQRRNRLKGQLLNTDLSKEKISEYKQVFEQIQTKTKEAENVSDISRCTKLLSEQMERQDKYYKSGGVNENMTLDAKCISTNAAITCQLVKRLQTDSKVFDSQEFAEKLKSAFNPFHGIDGTDPNDSIRVDPNDCIEFARNYCQFHRVLPPFVFIYGSFDSSNERPQQKQPKPRVRHQKTVLTTQTEATQIDPNSKATEDSTPQEVQHILKTIELLETRNLTLPFIDVMVNPKSISETVENIFHSSFLIKDGMARLTADEEGLPSIASINNADIDLYEEEKGIQSILSFSIEDYKNWIEKFGIKKSAIRHLKKGSD